MSHRFEKHARTVTLLTLVSRMTGLARDAALSRIFGVSPLMDAFWFAFMIPNLFRRLFGEGALSSAFLPVYTRLHASDPASARRLASLTLGLMVATLGGLTLIAEIVLFILSMRAGKHAYCEKPLTLTIDAGRKASLRPRWPPRTLAHGTG